MRGRWARPDPTPLLAALACAAALLTGAPTQAGETRNLQVSATVRQYLRIRSDPALPMLEVAEADLRQGYVDAPLPLTLEVLTNSAGEHQVQLNVETPAVRAVAVRDGAAPAGGQLVRLPAAPGKGLRRVAVQLRLRLYLSEAAVPGAYQWPVSISVLPE